MDPPADERTHPSVREPPPLAAQQTPRPEIKRYPASEIFITQHPAGAGRPGQHTEGERVGNDRQVGRTRHLLESHSAAACERGKRAGIGGIKRGGRDIDVVAGLKRTEESWQRDGFRARGAVRIRPGKADEIKVLLHDPALELVGFASLLLGPQTVSCNECGLFHSRHSVPTAVARNVDDRAVAIYIRTQHDEVAGIDARGTCRFDSPVAAAWRARSGANRALDPHWR